MTSPAHTADGLGAGGIAHTVIEVGDLDRARRFYADRLGLSAEPREGWPENGQLCLPCPSGQALVLAQAETPRVLTDSGVHQAYRAPPGAIDRIIQALAGDGIDVARYHEDRPEEAGDNVYFTDPDGNCIQLVAATGGNGSGGVAGIDHTAVQATDLEWEEEFYAGCLGLPVAHRVGWNTGDYVRARLWAEGKEDMAPWTRRWDERYRDIPGAGPGRSRRTPRPNMQLFFGLGNAVLGVVLATEFVPEPPPEQARGTPRTAYAMDRAALDAAATRLEDSGIAVEGPVAHPAGAPLAASLYFRDPCGNFIELCTPADGGPR